MFTHNDDAQPALVFISTHVVNLGSISVPIAVPTIFWTQGVQITGGSYNYRAHPADVMMSMIRTGRGRSRPLSQQLRVYRRCLFRRGLRNF